MALTLCVTLWAHEGEDDGLTSYEDEVLALLTDHGARVVTRVRRLGDGEGPLETQVIELPSREALEAYLSDPRRTALAGVRDRVVAHTAMAEVEQL